MRTIHPQYITDEKGKKLSVVLPIEEYKAMMEELDDLGDIRLYDEAKASDDSTLPIYEAFQKIEAKRKSNQ